MIQSLNRGIEILFIISERRSLGVTELAKELQINKSTAFRLLETLKIHNLVEQDEITSKYRLGIGILNISNKLVNNFDIIAISKSYLYKLVEITQETAHLCIFSSDKVFTLDQVKSSEIMKVSAAIGKAESLHCSAAGKCLLAYRPEKEINKILDEIELTPFTQNTITSVEILKDQLKKIRVDGYAVDNEELNLGVRCIATPIYNHMGNVINCLGISGPTIRIRNENIQEYIEKVKKISSIISTRLGYRGQ